MGAGQRAALQIGTDLTCTGPPRHGQRYRPLPRGGRDAGGDPRSGGDDSPEWRSHHPDGWEGACESASIVLKVTGVLRNLPTYSQLVADVLMPNTSVADRVSQEQKQNWLLPRYYTYVTLVSGADPQAVIAKLAPRSASASQQSLSTSKSVLRAISIWASTGATSSFLTQKRLLQAVAKPSHRPYAALPACSPRRYQTLCPSRIKTPLV